MVGRSFAGPGGHFCGAVHFVFAPRPDHGLEGPFYWCPRASLPQTDWTLALKGMSSVDVRPVVLGPEVEGDGTLQISDRVDAGVGL